MPGDSWNPFDTTPPPKIEVFGHQAYAERKFPDGILATFERTPLPEDAVVTHVTLAPYRGEKPVLAWKDGRLWLPSGEAKPGESPEEAIARVGLEQAGIIDLEPRHLGHFRCRTTIYTQKVPQGSITYQVLYGVEVGGLADFPSDPAYQRRQVLQRDMNAMLRAYYAEFRREYMETLDDYVLERLKAAAGS